MSKAFATNRATQSQIVHQPLYRASRDADALTVELLPGLVRSVHTEVLVPHTMNLRAQLAVSLSARRQAAGIALTMLLLVVRRWGDLQLPADRLDPKSISMIVDVPDHHLRRRSSSAWAK
jgi:hypothetical protein